MAAAVAAVVLSGAAYQTAFAQDGPVGPQAIYPRDDEGGLSKGEKLAIALGVPAAVLGGLFLFPGIFGADDDDDEEEQQRGPRSALPEELRAPAGIRLVPGKESLRAGASTVVDLQVKDAAGKWHSVNSRSEASIRVESAGSPLVRQNGTKNVFCLPVTARVEPGQSFVVTGTFAPQGGKALTARTEITVASAR